MADTRLTRISFWRAAYLCLLAILFPNKLVEEEEADNEERKKFPQPPPPREHSVFAVRRAFGFSFLFVIASGGIGYVIGRFWSFLNGCASAFAILALQIAGAMLLLWGTLFIRGWEIQTLGGVTLTERVNKWIYRSLYCAGTAMIICSLALSPCLK